MYSDDRSSGAAEAYYEEQAICAVTACRATASPHSHITYSIVHISSYDATTGKVNADTSAVGKVMP